ncbi:MAG TPA: hypothetical protein VHN18_04175, partial [Micromonosporaceae bacterium]|nr:hypothetical protein [Micromonosporaceae bacterium]
AAEVARVLAAAAGLPPPADDATGLLLPADDATGLLLPAGDATGLLLPAGDATLRLPAPPAGDRRRTRVLAAVGAAAAVALAVLVALALDEPGGSGSAARNGAGANPTVSGEPYAGTGGPAQGPAVTASTIPADPRTRTQTAIPRPAAASAAPKLPGVPFATLGGVVRVACDGSTARVVRLNPTPGYTVKDYDAGPADEVQVVLLSARNETELKVKCEDGEPVPTLKESPQ